MWRIGFRLWSTGRYLKYGASGLLVLLVIWTAQGFSPLFWLVALVVAAVLYGTRSTLLDLARRENSARTERSTR